LSDQVEDALDDLGLGTTAGDLLELANRALAGQSTGDVSLSTISGLLTQLNEGFEGNCDDCDDEEDSDSASVRLLGNDPNPFSVQGSTVIRFELLQRSDVTLEVFDIRGRKVATLLQGVMPAGVTNAGFDASSHPGLPSGIYLYRLSARAVDTGASTVRADKMLLIR
jgi:hypothetical protein